MACKSGRDLAQIICRRDRRKFQRLIEKPLIFLFFFEVMCYTGCVGIK